MAANPWLDRLVDVALSPALWLGVLLALAYSTLFTAWRGGGWRQWLRDMLTGVFGFGIGQAAGMLFGSTWLRVGDLQLLWGTLTTVVALAVSRRLRPPPPARS